MYKHAGTFPSRCSVCVCVCVCVYVRACGEREVILRGSWRNFVFNASIEGCADSKRNASRMF
jgi:hypothetical protein